MQSLFVGASGLRGLSAHHPDGYLPVELRVVAEVYLA
jgi:hypothetical protein